MDDPSQKERSVKMYKKSYFLALLISFLLSLSLINRNVDAQLDLNKLTDKKSTEKESFSDKEAFFSDTKEQIISYNVDRIPTPHESIVSLRGPKLSRTEKTVRAILENDYNVRISGRWGFLVGNIVRVMDLINRYYQCVLYHSKSVDYAKERLGILLENVKGEAKRRGGDKEVPKIMKFINDYNELVSSTYDEVRENKVEQDKREAKLREEQETKAEIKRKEELQIRKRKTALKAEAKSQAGKALKAKIDPIIKYAMANRTKLEKESELFRKNVSKVWYDRGDHFTINLLSPDKIIMVGNKPPIPVQIAGFDKSKRRITVYVTKDGKIAVDKDGKLFGFVIRMIMISHKKFKLGIRMTDGIEFGPESVLSFVRNLK